MLATAAGTGSKRRELGMQTRGWKGGGEESAVVCVTEMVGVGSGVKEESYGKRCSLKCVLV